MPYPKGIKDPAVRDAWLRVRRERVRRFDALVAGGMARYQAARTLGLDVSSLDAMRRSVEQLEEGGHIGREGNSYIDLGLALLAHVRKPGETLTAHDIAAWCGCSRAAIQAIESRALRKVRRRLVEAVADRELAEELRRAFAGERYC